MIKITESAEGIVISVRAQPGARRTAIVGVHGEALKVAVQAPPVDGKANATLEQALAEWLGLKKSQVALAKGASSRDKAFSALGIDAETARARLASHLPPA
jgi:uncharacterized protein (TIGR00251 family)